MSGKKASAGTNTTTTKVTRQKIIIPSRLYALFAILKEITPELHKPLASMDIRSVQKIQEERQTEQGSARSVIAIMTEEEFDRLDIGRR